MSIALQLIIRGTKTDLRDEEELIVLTQEIMEIYASCEDFDLQLTVNQHQSERELDMITRNKKMDTYQKLPVTKSL